MRIQEALQRCCRLRHRDWPPYQYAEIRSGPTGSLRLYVVKPNSAAEAIDLQAEIINDDSGWVILDHGSDRLSR
jgi:hypothetical protein